MPEETTMRSTRMPLVGGLALAAALVAAEARAQAPQAYYYPSAGVYQTTAGPVNIPAPGYYTNVPAGVGQAQYQPAAPVDPWVGRSGWTPGYDGRRVWNPGWNQGWNDGWNQGWNPGWNQGWSGQRGYGWNPYNQGAGWRGARAGRTMRGVGLILGR
jgi:hypothetical protein